MKRRILVFILISLIGCGIGKSATLSWANTNGGDWNIATNWTPNQVPGSGDNVIITNSGTYTVTNYSSATLGNFILGGTNGVQTVILSSLTLSGAGNVGSNGVVYWGGGTINGSLTLGQGSMLYLTNNTTYGIFGPLTNNGTVNWLAGSLYGYGPPTYAGSIYNTGLWNAQFDGTLTPAAGTPLFINTGTFRKSGGTGTTAINWDFTSTGIFDTQTGSFSGSTWVSNNIVHGTYTGGITLYDTNATLLVASNAVINWNSGTLYGSMTVGQGGVVNLTNNTTYSFFSTFTNNGTVNWSAGGLSGYGPPTYMGSIYNAGLWNAQFDGTLSPGSGTPLFINTGTFRKSAGTGTTSINWDFTSTGIFDTQTGSFSGSTWVSNSVVHGTYTGGITLIDTNATLLVASNAVINWNSGSLYGYMTVAQGGVLNLTNNTTWGIYVTFTNNGTVNWSLGSIYGYGPPTYRGLIYNAGLWNVQFDGTLSAGSGTPLFINTGTFRKSSGNGTTTINFNFTSTGVFDTQTGQLSSSTWVSNSIVNGTYTGTITINDTNATVLVASNAVVNWNSGSLYGSMTVAQGGVLNLTNNTTWGIYGTMTNNGTVNWSLGSIYGYGPPTYIGLIYNTGLWNAQFDGSFTAASGTPAFINTGTFRKSGGIGTTTMNWNFTSTGIFDVQTGLLSVNAGVGNSIFNGNFSGSISIETNSTATIPANTTLNWSSGTIAAGGVFNVASNAVVNWGGGSIYGSLTVVQGGVLSLTNNTTYAIYGTFTNNGTVNWSLGSLYGYGPATYTGLIYNAGLWNIQFDGTFTAASGTPLFINTGTFRKSAGTGTTTISWNFTSTGIFDTQTGQLSSSTWVSNSIAHGTYTGTITLNDTNATVLVASNAVVNWNNGSIYSSLTVGQGGVLNLTNNTTWGIYGTLTNNGTVNWSLGSVYGYGPPTYTGLIYNAGLWNAQFGGTLTPASGTPAFLNTGIFRKTAGNTTTTVNWAFTNNMGTLDSQTNNISLSGNYNLNGGTLNVGIYNLTNYGTITLSGAAPLTGTVSANLNNGYIPIGGNAFTNILYSSFTGLFTNAVLPFADAWSTNYHATFFVLNVLNARPVIVAPVTNLFVVNELTALNVTNTATDADIPAQTLAYSLVTGINGMVVNPATGVLAWTPQQTNSPATNTVAVAATDNGTPALSATNTYTVIVKEVNVAPSLPVISTQIVNELTLLMVNNTATNFNIHSTITGYTLVNPPSGMAISAGGVITWTPAQVQSPATNVITTIVTNSNPYDLINPSLTSTNQFTVIVREVNVAPSLPVISTQSVNELTLLNVPNTATNFNIHSIITGYTLVNPPSGMVISAGGIITWTPAQTQSPATNVITTVVTNSNPYDLINPSLTSTNQFTVIVKEVNVAPSLPTVSTQIVNELTLLTVTNTATNANIHATITGYRLVNPPSNMVINASGIITWTPAQAQSPGTNLITTVVTNSDVYDLVNPILTSTNSFTVIVKEVNVPASLPTISTQIVNELTLLTVTNTATNANIHAVITGYRLVSPPSNMVINASGVITWTPAQAQSPGTNLITTVVTNSDIYDLVNPILTTTNSFTVIVREVNVPASLPTISTQVVNELTLLTVTNTATNANIHAVITGYTLVNSPGNMAINANGIITWTPTQVQSPGTNLITTIVTNSDVYDLVNPILTSTNSFTVIVKEVNVAPVLSVISTQTVTVLHAFSITNNATEPNLHSVTGGYLLLASPAGAAINSSGVITWAPVQNQTLTTNTISTVVTNSNPYDLVNPHLSSTNSFTVIVLPNTGLTNIVALNSGGTNLVLNWPADHTGWRLEIQTNSILQGLRTNWVAFSGSAATNSVVVPIIRTNGSVFFRMVYP